MSAQHRHHGDWYEIRIQGRLDDRWSAWLDDLVLSHTDDGTTVLRGPVADQAALHGLLNKLRDLGLPLLSITQTDPGDPTTPTPRREQPIPPGSPRAHTPGDSHDRHPAPPHR